ncbi:hypothetical protein D3C75_1084400 [compost metagenome]
MSDFQFGLAQVAVVEADSQGQVTSISSALVLAHPAITQRREGHGTEGVTKLAKILDLANLDVGVSLVEGFGVGAILAADRNSAAGGCIEVVFGHGGSSKGTLDKSRGAAGR